MNGNRPPGVSVAHASYLSTILLFSGDLDRLAFRKRNEKRPIAGATFELERISIAPAVPVDCPVANWADKLRQDRGIVLAIQEWGRLGSIILTEILQKPLDVDTHDSGDERLDVVRVVFLANITFVAEFNEQGFATFDG